MTRTFETLKRGWFRPFTPWRVRRRGRADGRLQPPIPPWTAADQPPYVMEIKRAGDGDLQLVNLGWDGEDRELKARYSEAKKHHDHATRKQERAEAEFKTAVARYEKLHEKPAPTRPDRGGLVYVGIATLISAFEIPINVSFFRLMGENEVFTAITTVGMACTLMFCAHFLGTMLKEGALGDRVRKLLIATMIAIPLALIGGVAFLRVAYIQQVAETARNINPIVLLIVSAALNLLMVTVATVAAYVFHQEGRRDVDRTRRDLQAANRLKDRAEKELSILEEHRRKTYDEYKTRAQHIKDVAEGLIEAYRTANLASRADRDQHQGSPYPASFLQEVVIKIPMPLRSPEPPPLGGTHATPSSPARASASVVSEAEAAS